MKIVCFACDCYAYLAPVWEYCLYRVWPDCPYEVVYIANSRPLNVSGTVYHVKKGDADFGGRLRAFVSRHTKPGDLILLVLIDHLIRGVDITIITQAEKLCAHPNVATVRLFPMPHPQLSFPLDLRAVPGVEWSKFKQIDKSKPYSLSTQPSIWDAHDLAKCAKDGESPWHTETFGSGRTKKVKKVFLGTHEYAMTYVNFWYRREALGVGWVRENVPKRLWPDIVKKRGKK